MHDSVHVFSMSIGGHMKTLCCLLLLLIAVPQLCLGQGYPNNAIADLAVWRPGFNLRLLP